MPRLETVFVLIGCPSTIVEANNTRRPLYIAIETVGSHYRHRAFVPLPIYDRSAGPLPGGVGGPIYLSLRWSAGPIGLQSARY